ncbi:hypothetical protein CRG98_042374 [Punica granatum]|nr:hypothetical protein CRG98_042374 [Punica granatum]
MGELQGRLPVLVRQCPCLEEGGVRRSGALNGGCGGRSTVGGGRRGGERGPGASNGGWGGRPGVSGGQRGGGRGPRFTELEGEDGDAGANEDGLAPALLRPHSRGLSSPTRV